VKNLPSTSRGHREHNKRINSYQQTPEKHHSNEHPCEAPTPQPTPQPKIVQPKTRTVNGNTEALVHQPTPKATAEPKPKPKQTPSIVQSKTATTTKS